jgi:hypothetical protein
METTPRSQPPMQESSRPLKIRIFFANDGTIIEKQDLFQEIN